MGVGLCFVGLGVYNGSSFVLYLCWLLFYIFGCVPECVAGCVADCFIGTCIHMELLYSYIYIYI